MTAAAAADYSSSSSSFSIGCGNYDVFLSFRGLDTRKIFVGHLYNALQRKALTTFRDTEELKKGDTLQVLLNAIEQSKLSVVVLSKNYASSKWCLMELVKIMECMDTKEQIVVPIFYQVEPADVRHQRNSFKDAFAKHQHHSRVSMEEQQRWKSALTLVAGLSGWDSRDFKDDAKLIDRIVGDIWGKLMKIGSSKSNDLVGMDAHIHEMEALMEFGLNDVRIVGIWGMGGIGKTTIARAVYDKFAPKFEACCFLDNVKENFKRKSEVQMQEELLFRILKKKVRNLGTLNIGSEMVIEMLSKRQIFVVLDDVDSLTQVEALLGKQRSFGVGSRIIITTRDKSLLSEFKIYDPKFMKNDEALELFRKYAKPSRQYNHLLRRAINYAQGLPLALRVLGASLHSKSICEWEDEFEKIKKFQDKGIMAVLRTSYEGLDDSQKKIFLDVACFFRGIQKDYVTIILEACGLFPKSGFRVLVDRALVTTSGYYSEVLGMHDLLQDMAFEIVRQESKPSRLTIFDDIEDVLTLNMETEAVESIDLDLYNSKDVDINTGAFVSMKKLRLLRIHYNRSIDTVDDYYGTREELYHLSYECKQQVSGDLKFLSHELRCLIWHGYPFKSLPSNFHPKHLVDLDMRWSRIEQLWQGAKPLKKLKYINLSRSPHLMETPDLTKATNLEIVNLEGCISLLEVHPSIVDLKNLIFLSLKGCKELKILPSSFRMKSLETLDLSGCSNLENFPEIPEVLKELPRLCLDKTAIRELPSSIKNLRGLVTLSLKDCRQFKSLPSSICRLKSLRYLTLSGCSKFEVFPKMVGVEDMEELRELHLDGTSIKEFLPSISALQKLVLLSLRECKELKSLPSSIYMPFLKTLFLSGCSNLEKFPDISVKMDWLSELNLDDIGIEELPPSIKNLCQLKSLSLKDCGELKSLPSSIFQLECLREIIVSGCLKFAVFPNIEEDLEGLEELYMDQTSTKRFSPLENLVTLRLEDCGELWSLPSSICQLKSLRYFALSGCSKFEEFPEILEDMEELRELHLNGTSIKELFPSIERLKRLILLNMRNCRSLVCLPDNICNLSYLAGLTLSGCSNLSNLPMSLGNLESLQDLEGEGSGIEQDPFYLLCLNKSLSSINCLVGMDRHIHEMQKLLDQVDNGCVVGICGIGGLGKTTIARVVYDKIAHQFEHHCFLENVKEGFTKHGTKHMQEELLSRIPKEKVHSLGILNGGSNMIMERLGMKKVLLVLDDVDNITQIETLLGKPWPPSFGGGSRIIVTSRDEQVLSGLQIYRPKQLCDAEAFKLFRQYAFRTIEPSREYRRLSWRVIQNAHGLPLELKVWGAFLFNKSIHEWKDALKDKHTVHWVLTKGFDGLHYSERNIFLDVAWFFKGMKKEYVTKVLHSCGFFPYSALKVLLDRSLLVISARDGTLNIHDLLQGTVRDFVSDEDEHEPGKRSRLQGHEGINCLSDQNMVTEAVEVITLDLSNAKAVYLNAEAFVTMKKLRLLQIHDNGIIQCKQHLSGDFEFISHELRCLIWHGYPLKSLPSNFHPKNLVDLDMRYSHLEQLWEGTKTPKNLAFINLSHSPDLKKTPDLTEAKNLEKLNLEGCTSLLEVHSSIFYLKNLDFLSLKGCRELKILPSRIDMKSLKNLDLSSCSNLEKFPEISGIMMELSDIDLDETAIKKLPSSIERLRRLKSLSMRNCRRLVSLPDSICNLAYLQQLYLDGCSKLSKFPENLRNMQSLTISGIEELPFFMRNRETESEGVSESCSESGEESEGKEEKEEMEGEVSGMLEALYSFLSWLRELCRRGREKLSLRRIAGESLH